MTLDAAATARFERERQAWFPAARNLVPAHLTLFHRLPGDEEAVVARELRAPVEMFHLTVDGVRNLGGGVAYTLRGPALDVLRGRLARVWRDWLVPQDRQTFRAHVTVQNKVEAGVARDLHATLAARFAPFVVTARGLALWRYRGGPWEAVAEFPFVPGSAEVTEA